MEELHTTAIASEDPISNAMLTTASDDEGGLGGEKEKDPEAADKRLLSKYTDPTENFVTDAFCAQMLSDDMDPDHGRQVIQNLREALQRKRERELAEARARKGGAKGKRKLQFVGQVIGKLEEMFSDMNALSIVPVNTLRKACRQILKQQGFERHNTVFARCACPEDQVRIFKADDFLPFGGPNGYKLGGVGGLPSCGELGMFMLGNLVPDDDGRIMIEFSSIMSMDEYGAPGRAARKDDRSALLDVVKVPTFPEIALKRLQREIDAKRQAQSILSESQRKRVEAKDETEEGEETDFDTLNEAKLDVDEFDDEIDFLKSSLASHFRHIRKSKQSATRIALGLYDEIRSQVDALIKYLFDSKREEAQAYLDENEHRFERQYKNELALSMTREGRRELESRGRLGLYSRDSTDSRKQDTLEARNKRRLNDLYLEFTIPVASLGALHIQTPPSFPDFAVVQRFDVLRSDGDRVVLIDKLLRQIREIRSKEESSSDDSNSEDSSDGSDNG
eukprot:g15471.t1